MSANKANLALHASRKLLRYALFVNLAVISAGQLVPLHGYAQTYPAKTVRIIVPFAPGGGTDFVARILAQKLSESLGQSVVVENRPGAGSTIGTELVAKAAPDGYTLLVNAIAHAINASVYRKLPFDSVKDFAPVAHLTSSPYIVLVHPSIPVRSIKELIVLAKTRPGELTYASAGKGSSTHLATEFFRMLAQVDILHIPYKGGAPALTDLLRGEVALNVASLPIAIPHVRAGKLKPLAVTGSTRARIMPELPTVAEAGVADYEFSGWYGMLAPVGTRPEIVTRLNADVIRVLNLPEVRERLASDGSEAVGGTPEQFGTHLRNEIAKWAKVVAHLGMRFD